MRPAAHPRRLLGAALAVALLAPVLAARPARAGDLEAGFGRRSLVTKIPGITLAGYGGKGLLAAQGVHDAPFVKAMVLRPAGGRAIALVTADLVGVQRTLLEALRAKGFPERVRLGADDVLIAASHTHSSYGSLARPTGGPGLDVLFFACCGPRSEPFFAEVVGKVRDALVDAWDDLAPARLGVAGEAVPGLAHNRGGSDVIDREIGVLRVTAPDGRVRGILVNFAGHPVILGGENFLVSAEWPGAMQRALEARYPGASALFTQGAAGDVTASAVGPKEDPFARVEATGERIAEHVARIADGIEARPGIAVAMRQIEVSMPRSEAPGDWLNRLGGPSRGLFAQAVIGDTLLMGVPGEPCARIGLDLKAAARARGFRHAFVVGLAQDHLGYFVHRDDYARPTHAYEKRLNFYGPAIGEHIRATHFGALDPRPLTALPAPAGAAEF